MKRISHIILVVIVVLLSTNTKAQVSIFQPGDYNDGIYEKENATNRRYIPYTHLREGDVMWEKRTWRRIDMREKTNQPLYYPTQIVVSRFSFLQLLLKYILNGQIMAFSDEEFQVPYEKSAIRDKLVLREDSAEQELFDKDGNSFMTMVAGSIDSTWIYELFQNIEVKEDWFFDKQKSVLEVRILGLGINALKKGKEDLGPINAFWVYFPACRPFFAKHEVYNTKNDSERRTFEDIFWKRQFASVVYKETNVYDREIQNYTKGLDALLESDRIKGDIFKWEHDLWHF